jgi:hypothetical protein
MQPKGSCKCQHCGEFFVPDVRNRTRQRYCRKVPCRKARKAESQRRWLSRPENADYFRGADNAARARAWQAAHPGYWKKRKRRKVVLQDRSKAEPASRPEDARPDATSVLQDDWAAQSPVLVGLIAHLTGSVLQADIAAMTRRLHSRGRAVLGADVPRPAYGKTPDHNRAGAARAAPV